MWVIWRIPAVRRSVRRWIHRSVRASVRRRSFTILASDSDVCVEMPGKKLAKILSRLLIAGITSTSICCRMLVCVPHADLFSDHCLCWVLPVPTSEFDSRDQLVVNLTPFGSEAIFAP